MNTNTALTYLEAATLKEVLHDAITNWNGETEWPLTLKQMVASWRKDYTDRCEVLENMPDPVLLDRLDSIASKL